MLSPEHQQNASMFVQADAHEAERAFRKVKRHNIVTATEYMKVDVIKSKTDIEMRDAMLERVIKPKIELMDDDEDSSSDDSDDDDSDSEEEAVALGSAVVKQEITKTAKLVLHEEPLFQGGVAKWYVCWTLGHRGVFQSFHC